jgi:hypothetical protein
MELGTLGEVIATRVLRLVGDDPGSEISGFCNTTVLKATAAAW